MEKPRTKEELIEASMKRIAELERENEQLRGERDKYLRRARAHAKSVGSGEGTLLAGGGEPEFYPNEKREILLEELKEARKRLPNGTRRADVLDSVLAANKLEGTLEKRAAELKTILKGYKTMNAMTRSKLENLGIDIEETKRHYKLRYYGDSRYIIPLACSGSDSLRGGKNSAAGIIQKFF